MPEFENDEKVLPPLSQSRHGDMACEALYVHKHVWCERAASSEAAERGIEVHEILATYINHLVRTRRSTDLEVFDALMKGASIEAREVLDRFRDNHAFDPKCSAQHFGSDVKFSVMWSWHPKILRLGRWLGFQLHIYV